MRGVLVPRGVRSDHADSWNHSEKATSPHAFPKVGFQVCFYFPDPNTISTAGNEKESIFKSRESGMDERNLRGLGSVNVKLKVVNTDYHSEPFFILE